MTTNLAILSLCALGAVVVAIWGFKVAEWFEEKVLRL